MKFFVLKNVSSEKFESNIGWKFPAFFQIVLKISTKTGNIKILEISSVVYAFENQKDELYISRFWKFQVLFRHLSNKGRAGNPQILEKSSFFYRIFKEQKGNLDISRCPKISGIASAFEKQRDELGISRF